jgi:hypothetical protein
MGFTHIKYLEAMRILIIFCLSALLMGSSSPQTTIEMEQADKYRLAFTIAGNDDGTHYMNPIMLNIENKESGPVLLHIPVGFLFASVDSFVQDMIVTQEQWIALLPGEKKKQPLQAMCTQSYNSGPSASSQYKAKGMARGSWVELSQFIAQKSYNNSEGQMAMWALTSGMALEEIGGWEADRVNEITAFTAGLLKKDPPPPMAADDYRRNYQSTNYKMKIRGTVNYENFAKARVMVGMFNAQNILVREVYLNEAEPPHPHLIEYAFDGTEYTDPVYNVKLIIDHEVVMNFELRTPDRN